MTAEPIWLPSVWQCLGYLAVLVSAIVCGVVLLVCLVRRSER